MVERKVLNVDICVVVEASQSSQEMLWSFEVSMNLLAGPMIGRVGPASATGLYDLSCTNARRSCGK